MAIPADAMGYTPEKFCGDYMMEVSFQPPWTTQILSSVSGQEYLSPGSTPGTRRSDFRMR